MKMRDEEAEHLTRLRGQAVVCLLTLDLIMMRREAAQARGEPVEKHDRGIDSLRASGFPPIAYAAADIVGMVGTMSSYVPARLLVSTTTPENRATMGEICALSLRMTTPGKHGPQVLLHELREVFTEIVLPPPLPSAARDPAELLAHDVVIDTRDIAKNMNR